jgi:hypothetical protein
MNWELKQVSDTDWIQDDSGYYTLIHYITESGMVRIDIMDKDDMPVVSFQGLADDVRKTVMRWFKRRSEKMCGITRQQKISYEHASYIGAELTRCALQGTEYIQD